MTQHDAETFEGTGYRVLVMEPSAKVRRDYEAVLGTLPTASGVGRDSLEAILASTAAPPPGFPSVELTLCRRPDEALRAVRQAKEQLRPFAVAFVELGDDPTSIGLLERMRDHDEAMNIVLVTAGSGIHPNELAERVPPLDQFFYLQKPFHAFEIQQLVLALGARWLAERMEGTAPGGRAVENNADADRLYPRFWDSLPVGIIVFDRRDRFVCGNEAARKMLPELLPAFAPGTPYKTFQLELARRLLPKDTVIREEAWLRDRLEWHAKSGSVLDQRLVDDRWVLFVESGGAAGETFCLLLDISSLKIRDQSRAMQERVKQMAGVADALCAELLKTFWGQEQATAGDIDDSAITRLIEHLRAVGLPDMDGARAERLVRRLERIVHPKPMRIESLNANDVIAGLVRNWAPRQECGIEVVAGAGLWIVDCDRGLLEECLRELLANAASALEGAGRVSIETANVRMNREFVVSRPSLKPGDYVRVSVIDAGRGMAPEVAVRAMNPFFRGDESSSNMGLGLSDAFASVDRLGGYLEIGPDPEQGTMVTIYLPRSRASAKRALPSNQGVQGKGTAA